ncbi:MAG: hypothetical protein ABIZ81_03190 [Opitutaceae bacterium]
MRFASQHPLRRAGALRSRKGSVLIVALLITALIALALGSFINLNLTSSRLAKRTLNGYAGLNLGEAGIEEGVWSINRHAAGDAAAWNGWTQSGGAAWHKFTDFDLNPGIAGTVKVYVDQYAPPVGLSPKVIALAAIQRNGEAPITKMLEVTLRRRSHFANAIVAKNRLVFHGTNTSVDSWNSDPDQNSLTPPVDYSPGVRIDHGSIAAGSAAVNALLVNHAQVWGYAATGGAPPQLSSAGSIRGVTTPVGVAMDPNRVSTDFNADFPPITMPADGVWLGTIGTTLGNLGTTTRWRSDRLSLSGTQTLTIRGDVTLIITAAPGTPGVNITGQASIIIPAGSSLALYLESDLLIGGLGLTNANVQPGSFKIWGTDRSTLGQSFQIAGNGALKAAIYAPNADIQLNGNGAMMGSLLGRNITFMGNAAFHFDEALANTGGDAPFGVGRWRELIGEADRSPYLNLFSGW